MYTYVKVYSAKGTVFGRHRFLLLSGIISAPLQTGLRYDFVKYYSFGLTRLLSFIYYTYLLRLHCFTKYMGLEIKVFYLEILILRRRGKCNKSLPINGVVKKLHSLIQKKVEVVNIFSNFSFFLSINSNNYIYINSLNRINK